MKLSIEILMSRDARGPVGEQVCHIEHATHRLDEIMREFRDQGAIVQGMSGILRDDAGRLCGQWRVE